MALCCARRSTVLGWRPALSLLWLLLVLAGPASGLWWQQWNRYHQVGSTPQKHSNPKRKNDEDKAVAVIDKDQKQLEEVKAAKNKKKHNKKSKSVMTRAQCEKFLSETNPPSSSLYAAVWKRLVRRWKKSRKVHTTDDSKVAYEMAIFSSLAYWEFHKKELPDHRHGFRIISSRGRRRDRAKRILQKTICRANAWMSYLPHRVTTRLNHVLLPPLLAQYHSSMNYNTTRCHEPRQSDSATEHKRLQPKRRWQLEYSFYNWYEPTVLGNFHDTDVLMATTDKGKTLVIAFAGTASVTDSVTNLQTFEPANHSKVFSPPPNSYKKYLYNYPQRQYLKGSLHRGFLNAYAQVERGHVLKLCSATTSHRSSQHCHMNVLQKTYGHCTLEKTKEATNKGNQEDKKKHDTSSNNATMATSNNTHPSIQKRPGGCKIKHQRLRTILHEVIVDHLKSGNAVHITGHSLGGSIATLLALDLILNHSDQEVPINKLQVWTFGGAQVVDDAFLQSALAASPRLQRFLGHERFHRYVTVSDDCQTDLVSTVAQQTISPHNQNNVHGKTARKLGGIQGTVVHVTEPPLYLFPPEDEDTSDDAVVIAKSTPKASKPEPRRHSLPDAATSNPPSSKRSTTRSALAAHAITNYVGGISRLSREHPLSTDLPDVVRDFLGE